MYVFRGCLFSLKPHLYSVILEGSGSESLRVITILKGEAIGITAG